MDSYNKKHDGGFLMLDVLMGLFVASIITMAFLGSVVGAVRYANMQTKAVQAELLAIEMLEVARELETSNWTMLSDGHCTGTPCHPEVNSSNEWILETGTTTTNGFARSLHIEKVKRDTDTHVMDPNGDDIEDSQKVTAHVEWSAYGEQRTLTLETYVYEYVSK